MEILCIDSRTMYKRGWAFINYCLKFRLIILRDKVWSYYLWSYTFSCVVGKHLEFFVLEFYFKKCSSVLIMDIHWGFSCYWKLVRIMLACVTYNMCRQLLFQVTLSCSHIFPLSHFLPHEFWRDRVWWKVGNRLKLAGHRLGVQSQRDWIKCKFRIFLCGKTKWFGTGRRANWGLPEMPRGIWTGACGLLNCDWWVCKGASTLGHWCLLTSVSDSWILQNHVVGWFC